jgi:hypothetical protein
MGNIKSRGKKQGKQSYTGNMNSRETEIEAEFIHDVPNEVIQKNIMAYLSYDDIKSFSMTGRKRFKVIADDELEKRRKRRK